MIDGATVRRLRSELKLSQDDLAQRVGVTRVSISDIERGVRSDMRVSTLSKLAKALGVSPSALIGSG